MDGRQMATKGSPRLVTFQSGISKDWRTSKSCKNRIVCATKGTRTRRQKRIQPREEQPLPLMTTTNTTTRMLRTKRLIMSPCTKNKKPWTANVQKSFVSPQLQNKIEQIHTSRPSPDENVIQQSHILVTLNFEAVPL